MDPRLLQVLQHRTAAPARDGRGVRRTIPKIAARLGMNGLEVTDPYVERLLEGVGFLAARAPQARRGIPALHAGAARDIYPHYLAPTPSMLIAQFTPDVNEPGLASGVKVPRGTTMRGVKGADDPTGANSTSQDLTLWPVEVVSASYFSHAPDLPLTSLPIAQRIKGGIRIRLRTTAGLKFSQTVIDRLPLYLTGPGDVANGLYELCLAAGLARSCSPAVTRRAGTSCCRPHRYSRAGSPTARRCCR